MFRFRPLVITEASETKHFFSFFGAGTFVLVLVGMCAPCNSAVSIDSQYIR